MDNYLGFIEFLFVALFAMAWGVLELLGRRLDRKKEAERAKERERQSLILRRSCYRRARGMRNGSIACTTGILKRSSDRLSCINVTGSPSNLAEITDRA